MHFYNEWDKYAAGWLRNLAAAGDLPAGTVDERSIEDVQGAELRGVTQAHFFAGIGGWPLALRLAGWPESRPVWTGSCPCQPFSGAGKAGGVGDERHLWPSFLRLIAERRPPVVFGEQVASKLGRQWLSGVRADLEALGYAFGASDLCAAGIAAPHIRQRLYWVADAQCGAAERHGLEVAGAAGEAEGAAQERERVRDDAGDGRAVVGVGHSDDPGSQGRVQRGDSARQRATRAPGVAGFWSAYDVLHLTDGTKRRIEPGTFPLAHGVSARVGKIRAYGNAVVPELAAEFVRAYMEARGIMKVDSREPR